MWGKKKNKKKTHTATTAWHFFAFSHTAADCTTAEHSTEGVFGATQSSRAEIDISTTFVVNPVRRPEDGDIAEHFCSEDIYIYHVMYTIKKQKTKQIQHGRQNRENMRQLRQNGTLQGCLHIGGDLLESLPGGVFALHPNPFATSHHVVYSS